MKRHTAALLIAASIAAFVACGHSESTEKPNEPKPGSAIAIGITDNARDLIVAIVDDWNATRATLRRYRRDGGVWRLAGKAWEGVVGKSGTAWGTGLHGTGAPVGREGPIKREGDGKSPAGAFVIGATYGYAASAPGGTKVPYTSVDAAWKCVDDPASKAYNRVLDQRTTTIDWKSAEEMKRSDDLYKWVVDIGHNLSRTPNSGSCIFFHVWSGADSATLGCTAMAEPALEFLISTLDPSAVYVLLPRAEYSALAKPWGLPD